MIERLTPKHGWENASYDMWEICGMDYTCKRNCWKPTLCKIPQMLCRLAEYEDTGLSPEEIINLRDSEFMGIVCPRCEQKISKGDVYCRHCSQRLS